MKNFINLSTWRNNSGANEIKVLLSQKIKSGHYIYGGGLSILLHSAAPLARPVITLRCSELCGSTSQAQKSVVKQKHGLFTGFGFPCRCLWPGIVAKCQAESK